MRITFSKSSSSSSNKNKAKNKRTPRRSPTRTQNAILDDDDDVFLSSLSSLRASFSFSLFCLCGNGADDDFRFQASRIVFVL